MTQMNLVVCSCPLNEPMIPLITLTLPSSPSLLQVLLAGALAFAHAQQFDYYDYVDDAQTVSFCIWRRLLYYILM